MCLGVKSYSKINGFHVFGRNPRQTSKRPSSGGSVHGHRQVGTQTEILRQKSVSSGEMDETSVALAVWLGCIHGCMKLMQFAHVWVVFHGYADTTAFPLRSRSVPATSAGSWRNEISRRGEGRGNKEAEGGRRHSAGRG